MPPPRRTPKVPTPGGHIVSPRRLIYTCEYESNKGLSVLEATLERTSGARPHQAPGAITLRARCSEWGVAAASGSITIA